MNRIVTSALGMLVIAGVLYRPPASEVGPPLGTETPKTSRGTATYQQPGSTAHAEAAGATQPASAMGSNPCFDTSRPWDKLLEFFGEEGGRTKQGAPKPFLENLEKAHRTEEGMPYKFQYVIATLADPVHTNLQLYFDRGIDAIMRAAAESGYDFDSYWLPWASEGLPEEPNCYWRGLRKRSTEEKEQFPGLLLFRKPEPPGTGVDGKSNSPQLLFVFLVAETPTSGVEKKQFAMAVRFVQEMRGRGPASASDAIRILGPTFSGSVDSLIRAVDAAESQRVGPQLTFRVSSGSVTSPAALERLRTRVECRQRATCIEAGTTLANDRDALLGFAHLLQSQGAQRPEVALITEDRTAYGEVVVRHAGWDQQSQAEPVLSGLIVLRFPMKMASLRQAYQANPQVGVPGASQQVSLPRLLLPLSLTESTQTAEDDVPVFSKQQTPIAQEAQVIALAATLREKHIKYAGIVATDPLDATFLIRFLHRSAPDVRLFVPAPDLLFLRALDGDTAPLGLLAITSYPLLTASQEWLSEASGAERNHPMVFTNEYAEATYNSCLLLLNENKAGAPVRDASAVSWQPDQAPDLSLNPPLWLMMAGHSGYWPVTFLDDRGLTLHLDKEKLPRSWVLVWGLVSCLAFCHGLAVIVAQFARWRRLESFRLTGAGALQLRTRKAFFLLVATLSVLTLEGLLLYAPHSLQLLGRWKIVFASLAAATPMVVAAALLLVVVVGVPAVIKVFFFNRITRPSPWHLPGWYSSLSDAKKKWLVGLMLSLVVAACTTVLCLWKPWSCGGNGPHNYGAFFWYRSIHLTSGVSPVVPFCFLLAALYAWAWVRLKCLSTAAYQPRLWRSILLKPFVDADKELRRGIAKLLYHWKIFLVILVLTLLTFLAFNVSGHFAAPELSLFSAAYTFGVALIFLLLFSNWVRFLVIWFYFRRVLEGIDQLPLRAALRRLPKQYSWSPIWEHGGTRQSYEVLIRWLDNLQKLASVTGLQKLDQAYRDLWALLKDFAAGLTRSARTTPPTFNIQTGLRRTTRFIEETYLRSEWARGKSDSLAKEAQSSLTQESREREFFPNKKRILAEESLALYYLRYVVNVCLYMRFVLFFISAGFILALISLKSYPFQSEHTISLAVTAVFAVLGIGVIWVFVEMEKDAVLSCLADTEEGKLSGGFYLRLVSYGALPLFTFIAAQFPSVARFFFSWIQPSLSAFK